MIFQAIEVAARAHWGMYRKITRVPYLGHPLRVAQILIEHGFEEQPLAVAAVLHDTVEACGVTLSELAEVFGPEVRALVEAVTEREPTAEWKQRKAGFLGRLETYPPDVLVLACADKLDNLRSLSADIRRLGDVAWQPLTAPKQEQHWYYAAAAAVLLRRLSPTRGQALALEFHAEVERVFGSGEDYEKSS